MNAANRFRERISKQYQTWVRRDRAANYSSEIRRWLPEATTDDDRWYVRYLLRTDCIRRESHEELLGLLREEVRLQRDSPLAHVELAGQLARMGDATRARAAATRSVRLALQQKIFAYLVLAARARMAKDWGDWPLFLRSVREMARYRHKTGNADCFPEDDFLVGVPHAILTSRAVRDYLARRRYLLAIGYSTETGRRGRRHARRGA